MRDRVRGFTLVEILVVMTIIAALSASVLIVVPDAIARHRRLECADHLRQLGMFYTLERLESGGRPRHAGAGYFLAFRKGDSPRIKRGQESLLVCAGDPTVLVPKTEADRAEYDDADLAHPSADICSYVVRDFRAYPVVNDGPDLAAIAADRQGLDHRTAHHRGGINVLFADGSVKFLDRESLGIDAADAIEVGPESTNEMLRKLVYAAGGSDR